MVARYTDRFGPVMRGRVGILERPGLIAAGQRHEELVGDPW
jgi:release factor glutamine methyltransferase